MSTMMIVAVLGGVAVIGLGVWVLTSRGPTVPGEEGLSPLVGQPPPEEDDGEEEPRPTSGG